MTGPQDPRRRLVSAAPALVGWLLALAGAVALFLGWWGVSGTALPAKQIPYLVSGGLTGVCLLVLAAAWFASQDIKARLSGLDAVERQVAELYRLLTEEPGTSSTGLLVVPGGKSYHRTTCRLVQGRDDAEPVTGEQAAGRSLQPCRLCDPEPA
jgi:hypothetical protein